MGPITRLSIHRLLPVIMIFSRRGNPDFQLPCRLIGYRAGHEGLNLVCKRVSGLDESIDNKAIPNPTLRALLHPFYKGTLLFQLKTLYGFLRTQIS